MSTRREFLSQAGRATVVLLVTPLAFACGSSNEGSVTGSSSPTLPGCSGVGETSTAVAGHTHTICVPAADLASPPAGGATYTTSSASGHTHDVTLTQAELATIADGGEVTVTTTVAQSHTHAFAIRKHAAANVSPSRGGY